MKSIKIIILLIIIFYGFQNISIAQWSIDSTGMSKMTVFSLASWIYLYRITAENEDQKFVITKKLVLVK